jgi:FkbM family methyltransferase
MNLVQLGANVGKDHVQQLITKHYNTFKNIILVEPVPKCLPILKENYKHIDNVSIEGSVIISDLNTPPGEVDFYYPDYPEYDGVFNFEVSSLNKEHAIRNACGGDEYVKSFKLPSLNFDSLLNKYSLTTIDFLFIDIEGEDEKLLENLDLPKYDFKVVMWEYNHTDIGLKKKFLNLEYKIAILNNNYVAYKQNYENYISDLRQWL